MLKLLKNKRIKSTKRISNKGVSPGRRTVHSLVMKHVHSDYGIMFLVRGTAVSLWNTGKEHRAKLSLSRWVSPAFLANVSRKPACVTSHVASESGGQPARNTAGGHPFHCSRLATASQPPNQLITTAFCSANESGCGATEKIIAATAKPPARQRSWPSPVD